MLNALTILTQQDIETIHHTSLSILRDLGVSLPSQKVLDALVEAGADVDLDHQVARITPKPIPIFLPGHNSFHRVLTLVLFLCKAIRQSSSMLEGQVKPIITHK